MEMQNAVIHVVFRSCECGSKPHLGPMITMVFYLRIYFSNAKILSAEGSDSFTLKIVA